MQTPSGREKPCIPVCAEYLVFSFTFFAFRLLLQKTVECADCGILDCVYFGISANYGASEDLVKPCSAHLR